MKKNLTELVNTKPEKLILDNEEQRKILEDVKSFSLKTSYQNENNFLKLDYKFPEIKKRAQTIGLAFNIAAKTYLSLTGGLRDLVLNNYFEKNLFSFDNEKFGKLLVELQSMGEAYEDTFVGTLSWFNYQRIAFNHNYLEYSVSYSLEREIASNSVTAAWLLAKYKSGFFPADTSVMLRDSDTHRMMVEEVTALLKYFYAQVVFPLLSNHSLENYIFVEPTVEDSSGLECSVDFIVAGNILEITTASTIAANPPQRNSDCFFFMNKLNRNYSIEESVIRFIRFDKVFVLKE